MLHRLIASLRNLFRQKQADQELSAEIDSHVQLLSDEYVAGGMAPEAARRAAQIELGGREQVRSEVREARSGILLEQIWQDLRYGVRTLRKSAGFAALAVFTLALGIGANTAMFSVIDGVLLQNPPFAQPSRVTVVWQKAAERQQQCLLHSGLPGVEAPSWAAGADGSACTRRTYSGDGRAQLSALRVCRLLRRFSLCWEFLRHSGGRLLRKKTVLAPVN